MKSRIPGGSVFVLTIGLIGTGQGIARAGGGPAEAVPGRCCFLGIVPEPVLCAVTTEQECFQYAAPVSWTAGLTCETPCAAPIGRCCFVGIVYPPFLCVETTEEECSSYIGSHWTAELSCEESCDSAGDFFEGCGALGPGPQGCVIFHADSGEAFAIGNAGLGGGFNDHVWVRGLIDPQSYLCFPVIVAGMPDNEIAPCFEGCGVLIQGVECVLFSADSGGLYLLDHLGGFSAGDHVFVRGGRAADCVTFCMQGNGCILGNTIESCVPVGACCSPLLDNILGCIETTPGQCAEILGTYIGDGTQCLPDNPCDGELGRCCFLGIVPEPVLCAVTTKEECNQFAAPVSWTAGLTCETPCEEAIGRCCFMGIVFPPFLCAETTEEECSFYIGSQWTAGLTCEDPCDASLGSCCLDFDDGPLAYDSCIDGVSADECEAAGGVFQAGGVCEFAACCLPNGFCQETDADCCAASGGVPGTAGTTCENADCAEPVGACCSPLLANPLGCIETTEWNCLNILGTYIGDGTHCLPNNPCSGEPGRCCFLGIVAEPVLCEVMTEQECWWQTAPVSWTAGLTCDIPCESPCDEPGDVDGDGAVDGGDVAAFVRVKMGHPNPGDRPPCADLGGASLQADTQAFVAALLAAS